MNISLALVALSVTVHAGPMSWFTRFRSPDPEPGAGPRIERRSFFGLASAPLLGSYAAGPEKVTTPSPALVSHRTRHLAAMVAPEPMMMNGPVPPAFTLEYEVMRDWRRVHPESEPRMAELLAKFRHAQDQAGDLRKAGADETEVYAKIDAFKQAWDQMRALMTEEPWASLDWAQVHAEAMANMESRIAARLGVDIGRVYQFVEHALPERHGQFGLQALLRDVAKGFTPSTKPLYSGEALDVLYEEAAKVSDVLVFTFRNENPDDPHWQHLRRTLASSAGLPLSRQWFGEGPLLFELREDGQVDFHNPSKYVPRYRRALAWLERLHPNLARLDDSALKTELLEEVGRLRGKMREELATLPVRLAACEQPHKIVRATADDWRKAMDAGSVLKWAHTLRGFDLVDIAEAIAPAAEADCLPQLGYAPITPLEVTPATEAARDPVADK